MSCKVFINLEAALDYLDLEDIDADLAVIPPDLVDLTNEDELNDKDIATPLVRDVPSCSTEKKGFRATRTIRDAKTTSCPAKPAKEMDNMKRGTYDYRFDTENENIAVR